MLDFVKADKGFLQPIIRLHVPPWSCIFGGVAKLNAQKCNGTVHSLGTKETIVYYLANCLPVSSQRNDFLDITTKIVNNN